MGALMSSLVTNGQVINGMCYSAAVDPSSYPSFSPIPPERVGLKGEYDHYGLAKRVLHQCREDLGHRSVERLKVKQRGSVVLLYGSVSDRLTLDKIVQLAIAAHGTTQVEVIEVEVRQPVAKAVG